MIWPVIRGSSACLLLLIGVIFSAGFSSCYHAPTPKLAASKPAASQPHWPTSPSLVFSTYLGGSSSFAGNPPYAPLTFAQNAACDALGNIYVTGATQVSDLPVLNAFQPNPAAGSTMSAFLAKYDPAGTPLWCTYLGGNHQSMGIGVAVMPDGGVVVAGFTTSDATVPFPTTINAFQRQNNGQTDYFVTVFDASGSLTYSTYLGGSGVEGQLPPYADDQNSGNCVTVDGQGLIYIAGMTTSGGGSGEKPFPVTANALQNTLLGTRNACLCIIDRTQSGAASLVYSSFLGGDHDTQGHSVAVSPSGSLITVAGFTTSLNFPTTANAYRSAAPPGGFATNCSNGFVTQIQASQPGSPFSVYAMRYSTYLGGNTNTARDDVYGMTLDPTGLIVATGRTESADFPMTTGGPTIYNSVQAAMTDDEPYLVKIDPSLSGAASLVYSTFLGGGTTVLSEGKWGSFCTSVGIDSRGTVYVAGETNAPGQAYDSSDHTAPQDFPYTENALFPALQGDWDAIFMQIDPGGARLDYSTYLGGSGNDRTYGLAVDPSDNVVLTGLTFSSDFPLQNPAEHYPGNAPSQNAFVTKFSLVPGK
jgi:large repetitive protein